MKARAGKVAIIFPEAYLDSVPCLMSLINLLVQKGMHVDIFCVFNKLCKTPVFDNENIKLHLLEYTPSGKRKVLGLYLLFKVAYILKFLKFVLIRSKSNQYDICFGVEPDGLLTAFLVRCVRKGLLIYLSLEIHNLDGLGKGITDKLFRFLEAKTNRMANATIIQDEGRKEIVAKENGIERSKIYLLPNSPRGKARRQKRYFLYDYFYLDKSKVLLLHAGSISEWAYTMDLARAAEQLPSRYVTLFQSRYDLRGDCYAEGLKAKINQKKVLFSLEPFAYSSLDDLYASADIGLAFYDTRILGINCREIGLSSGKIAYYLFHGIPVIVNQETSLAELVRKYNCGVVINHFQELNQACDEIMADYKKYSDCSRFCFNELLAVDKYFERFYDEILSRKGASGKSNQHPE